MTMTDDRKTELSTKYDLDQHIKYILHILRDPDHHKRTLEKVLDEINFYMPEGFDYNPSYFIDKFAKFLELNDVIENATAAEVYAFSDKVIEMTDRNYRLVELIEAFQVILRAWEIQTESWEWA